MRERKIIEIFYKTALTKKYKEAEELLAKKEILTGKNVSDNRFLSTAEPIVEIIEPTTIPDLMQKIQNFQKNEKGPRYQSTATPFIGEYENFHKESGLTLSYTPIELAPKEKIKALTKSFTNSYVWNKKHQYPSAKEELEKAIDYLKNNITYEILEDLTKDTDIKLSLHSSIWHVDILQLNKEEDSWSGKSMLMERVEFQDTFSILAKYSTADKIKDSEEYKQHQEQKESADTTLEVEPMQKIKEDEEDLKQQKRAQIQEEVNKVLPAAVKNEFTSKSDEYISSIISIFPNEIKNLLNVDTQEKLIAKLEKDREDTLRICTALQEKNIKTSSLEFQVYYIREHKNEDFLEDKPELLSALDMSGILSSVVDNLLSNYDSTSTDHSRELS